MKSKTGGGGRGGARAALELKQRVIRSLNKLSDRDTHHIGAEELERMAADPCLAQQEGGISTFLSCIAADAGSDLKSSVRRESVRLLGTLACSHAPSLLLLPHLLAKMVASVVRRLRDADSSVRDACVEAAGALVSSIFSPGTTTTSSSMGAEEAAAFVTIAKPLFEALVGEQNRYVQMGSALCLARVIDEANHAGPLSLLPQMLARVVKLLKNPHFMAKPAVIELVRSIVQAGGASTEHALSTAVTSILETLRSVDWTTRKAASGALAGIALCAGPLLGSFKTSCIRSLESCRFDKVKPVRDTVMHALQCWKALPATGSTDPSEAGSSAKGLLPFQLMHLLGFEVTCAT